MYGSTVMLGFQLSGVIPVGHINKKSSLMHSFTSAGRFSECQRTTHDGICAVRFHASRKVHSPLTGSEEELVQEHSSSAVTKEDANST